MSGDLRAVLDGAMGEWLHADDPMPSNEIDFILAALVAADEPLVAKVECPRCAGGRTVYRQTETGTKEVECDRCTDGTTHILAATEDVVRERLRGVLTEANFLPDGPMADAIVAALFGGES